MELTLRDIERLRSQSGYFKAYFHFHNVECRLLNCLQLEICIPQRFFNATEFYTAIDYLLYSSVPKVIPYSITPIKLYSIGLYIDSDLLKMLALCRITPRGAPGFLTYMLKCVLSTKYKSATVDRFINGPDVSFVIDVICYYCHLQRSEVIDAINPGPNGDFNVRNLKTKVRYTARRVVRGICCLCGELYPDIKLSCCRRDQAHYTCFKMHIIAFSYVACPRCNGVHNICPPFNDCTKVTMDEHRQYRHLQQTCPGPYAAMLGEFVHFFPRLEQQYNDHLGEKAALLSVPPLQRPYGRPG
tara:strand:- start:161 stop:1060 length:900 start_codon:yes stop_codon:yes gene_type:complete